MSDTNHDSRDVWGIEGGVMNDKSDIPRQYAPRDPRALDRQGGHYSRHVSAMTAEGLHDKADIAAELAHRDAMNATMNNILYEVEQILGRALGYAVSPGSETDICTGDNDAGTLAQEAASRIAELQDTCERLQRYLDRELARVLELQQLIVGRDDIISSIVEDRDEWRAEAKKWEGVARIWQSQLDAWADKADREAAKRRFGGSR